MLQRIKNQPILFSILWSIFIFILCATPGQYIPNLGWLELLSFDKFVHLGIFFIQCSLLFLISIKHKQGLQFIAAYFLLAISYGLLLEFMQAKIFSNRSADWYDVIANTAGCILALIFFKTHKAYKNI